MAAETDDFGGPATDMKSSTVSAAVAQDTVKKPSVGVDDTNKKPHRFWWFRPSKRLTRNAKKLKSKMKKMLKKLKRTKSKKYDSQDGSHVGAATTNPCDANAANAHVNLKEYASSSVYPLDEEDHDVGASDCDEGDAEAEIFTPKFYNTPCTTNGLRGHIGKPKEVLTKQVILSTSCHWSAAIMSGLMVLCSKMEECQWKFDKLAVMPAAWKVLEKLEMEQEFHDAILISYFSSSFHVDVCGIMMVRNFCQSGSTNTTRATQKLICGSWPKLICAAPVSSVIDEVFELDAEPVAELVFEAVETGHDTENESEVSIKWAHLKEESTHEDQWEDSEAETVVESSDNCHFVVLEDSDKKEQLQVTEVEEEEDEEEEEESELVAAALQKFPQARELLNLDQFFKEEVAAEQPERLIQERTEFLQNLLDGLSDEDSSDSEDWDDSDESDDEMVEELVVATKAHKHQLASRSHTNSTPETRWRSLDEVYGFNGDIDCLHKELVIAGDFCTFNEDVIQLGHADYRETAKRVFEKLGEAIKTVQRQNLRKFADDSVAAFEFVLEVFECGLDWAVKCAETQKTFEALDSSDDVAVLTLLIETQMELGELDLWQLDVQLAVQKGEHALNSAEGLVDRYRCSTLQCAERAQRVIDQYLQHVKRVLVPALGETSEAEIHSMHGFESGKFEDMRRLWIAEELVGANLLVIEQSVEALLELLSGVEAGLKHVCQTLLQLVTG